MTIRARGNSPRMAIRTSVPFDPEVAGPSGSHLADTGETQPQPPLHCRHVLSAAYPAAMRSRWPNPPGKPGGLRRREFLLALRSSGEYLWSQFQGRDRFNSERTALHHPYMGTSGLSLYNSAGQLLRHLRWRQSPVRATLPHTLRRYRPAPFQRLNPSEAGNCGHTTGRGGERCLK
jgi:hypothetical protein